MQPNKMSWYFYVGSREFQPAIIMPEGMSENLPISLRKSSGGVADIPELLEINIKF